MDRRYHTTWLNEDGSVACQLSFDYAAAANICMMEMAINLIYGANNEQLS